MPKFLFIVLCTMASVLSYSQEQYDSEQQAIVNKCTPLDHIRCVLITSAEVYEDGKSGKATRHWWKMSYIGRACVAEHGEVIGKLMEGIFAIPHYTTMAIVNSIGVIVYVIKKPRKRREA